MPKSITTQIQDLLIARAVDLDRLSASIYKDVDNLLLQTQKSILTAIVSSENITSNKKRLSKLFIEIDGILDEKYGKIDKKVKKVLLGLSVSENKFLMDNLNKILGANIFDITVTKEGLQVILDNTLIDGVLIGDWFKKSKTNYRHNLEKVVNKVKQGIQIGLVKGDPILTILADLKSDSDLAPLAKAENELRTLVRTSVMEVANNIRYELYKGNSDIIQGVQVVATLDKRTTPLCRSLDKRVYDLNTRKALDGGGGSLPAGPPFHFNCRSTLVPVLYPYSKIITSDDIQRRKGTAIMEKLSQLATKERSSMFGPVSGSLDYNGWLKTQSVPIQKEILGEGKWKIWSEKGLSMSDMLDQSGRPLSLVELNKKYS